MRPQTCPRCNKRGMVEAHHKDYARPLEVTWLCRDCHWIEHKMERRTTLVCRICGSHVVPTAHGSIKFLLCGKHAEHYRRYGDPVEKPGGGINRLTCPHDSGTSAGNCHKCRKVNNPNYVPNSRKYNRRAHYRMRATYLLSLIDTLTRWRWACGQH